MSDISAEEQRRARRETARAAFAAEQRERAEQQPTKASAQSSPKGDLAGVDFNELFGSFGLPSMSAGQQAASVRRAQLIFGVTGTLLSLLGALVVGVLVGLLLPVGLPREPILMLAAGLGALLTRALVGRAGSWLTGRAIGYWSEQMMKGPKNNP